MLWWAIGFNAETKNDQCVSVEKGRDIQFLPHQMSRMELQKSINPHGNSNKLQG